MLGGGGFWAWVMYRQQNESAANKMLMGLGHQKIMELGLFYIDRGYITHDEYQDLRTYLFEPYKAMNGNGTAEKMLGDVGRLPFRKNGEN